MLVKNNSNSTKKLIRPVSIELDQEEKMNNKKKKFDARTIALLGIMTGVVILMSLLPFLGYIPLGIMDATIIHVPVIILGIVEGPFMGGVLGLIFGMTSLIKSYVAPSGALFFAFQNPLISVLPRILIGVLSGYVYRALRSRDNKVIKKSAIAVSAAVGTLVNSIGVLGLTYIIYASRIVDTLGSGNKSAFAIIAGIFTTSSVGEIIGAIIVSVPVCIALLKAFKKK